MRIISLVLLLAFAILVGLFAWENRGDVTLHFFDWQLSASLALLIGAVYVLGMLSGWSVLGMLKRGVQRLDQR